MAPKANTTRNFVLCYASYTHSNKVLTQSKFNTFIQFTTGSIAGIKVPVITSLNFYQVKYVS